MTTPQPITWTSLNLAIWLLVTVLAAWITLIGAVIPTWTLAICTACISWLFYEKFKEENRQ